MREPAAAALAAAVAAQGALLVAMGGLHGRAAAQVAAVTAAAAVLVHEAWRHRLRMHHRVDMVLVMGSVGGLGMLAGWWVDLGLGVPATGGGRACCGGAALVSWMTAGMLAGAIPPGLLLTRCAALAREGWRRWVATHVAGNSGMVAGMVGAGRAWGPMLAGAVGSPVVGMHLAMVAGMVLGMLGGTVAAEAALGLAPWREPDGAGLTAGAGNGPPPPARRPRETPRTRGGVER